MDLSDPSETMVPSAEIKTRADITCVPVQDKYALKLKMKFPEKTKTTAVSCIVIDKSGSMSGKFILNAKEGAKSLYEIETKAGNWVYVLAFNRNCEIISDPTTPDVTAKIDAIAADDSTKFARAIAQMQAVITDNFKNTHVRRPWRFIFLTDGDSKDSHLEAAMEAFKQEVIPLVTSFEIHCIGIGTDFDSAFVSQLTALGTKEGSIQDCRTSAHLKTCIDNIGYLLQTLSFQAYVQYGDANYIVDLWEIGDDRYTGALSLDVQEVDPQKLKVYYMDKEKQEVSIDFQYKLSLEPLDITSATIGHVRAALLKACATVSAISGLPVPERDREIVCLQEMNVEFDAALATCEAPVRKIKSRQLRSELMGEFLSVRDVQAKFVGALAALKTGTISNEVLAQFASTAYRHVIEKGRLRQGLQKKLDTKIQQNVDVYKADMEKVETFLVSLTAETEAILAEREADGYLNRQTLQERIEGDAYLRDLSCFICLEGLYEAVTKGKCLTYGCTTDRANVNVTIAEPTSLHVESISTTVICNECYHEKVLRDRATDPQAHAQFGKGGAAAEYLVKGLHGERFNSCIPVDLIPEHRFVSVRVGKPLVGFMFTADPYGFSFNQTLALYALALVHLNLQKQTEAVVTQKKHIQNTYTRLYQIAYARKDDEGRKVVPPHELFMKYVEDEKVRTKDVIVHNMIFLIQASTARNLKWIDPSPTYLEKFVPLFVFEECRRNSKKLVMTNADWIRFFGIDEQLWVKAHVAEYERNLQYEFGSKKTSGYRDRFILQLTQQELAIEQLDKEVQTMVDGEFKGRAIPNADPWVFDGRILEPTEDARKYISVMAKTFDYLRPKLQLFELFQAKVNCGFDDHFKTNETVLAFALQGPMYADNAHMRLAMDKKMFYSPSDQKLSEEFFRSKFASVVEQEKSSQCTQVLQHFLDAAGGNAAAAFANTCDLYEAAGALGAAACLGTNITQFIRPLQDANCNAALEKLLMLRAGRFRLRNGEYAGTALVAGIPSDATDPGWQMKRSHVYQFYSQNHRQLGGDKLIGIFKKYNIKHSDKWSKIVKYSRNSITVEPV